MLHSASATIHQAQVLNVIGGTSACDAFSSMELIRISGKCDAKRCQHAYTYAIILHQVALHALALISNLSE